MAQDAWIGVDIGGTNTPFGLMDGDGRLLWQETIPTRRQDDLPALLDRLFDAIEARLAAGPGGPRPRAIGVGAPNANALTGRIESPPNVSWGTCDLVAEARRRTDLPLALTNDANAAALGEAAFGAGRGMEHMLAITLGTGLGSGLIVDGRLLHGHSGMAGELGHVIVDPGGRRCGCGRVGCLETLVSAEGVATTARARLAAPGAASLLAAVRELTPRAVTEAAEAGDALAAGVWEETARVLGRALADATALLSPQAIVVCGGLARAGRWLFDPLREQFERSLLPVYLGTVEILPSGLPPDQAGVLGAAEWGRRETLRGAAFGAGR